MLGYLAVFIRTINLGSYEFMYYFLKLDTAGVHSVGTTQYWWTIFGPTLKFSDALKITTFGHKHVYFFILIFP